MEMQEKVCCVEENRKYERIEKNLAIRYGILEDFARNSFDMEGELLDIGAGGLHFLASEAIEISTPLVMQLEFPGWLAFEDKWIATKNDKDLGILQVIGMVVWVSVSHEYSDKFDIGISFSGVIR